MNWEKFCLNHLDFAKKRYKQIMNKDLDLNNPKTYTEKIWWLKIFDSTFLKSYCADKITMRNYCNDKLNIDLGVKILGIYDKPEQIDYSKLPNKFVIKCNHGSGYNIIVNDKNKININEINNKLSKWLNTDYTYVNDCELHYHNIPRKIFVEEFKEKLMDYKIFCFNGIPKFFQVDRHFAEKRMNFYDLEWNPLTDISRKSYPANYKIIDNKPLNFEKMIEYAKKLSADFKFVRVDFLEIPNGEFFLG